METTTLQVWNNVLNVWELKEFGKEHAFNLLQGYPKTFKTIDGSTINETAIISTDGKAKTVSSKAKTVASEPDLAVDKTVS